MRKMISTCVLMSSVLLPASLSQAAVVRYAQDFNGSGSVPAGWFSWYSYGGVGAVTVSVAANGPDGSNAYNYSFTSDGNSGGFGSRTGFYPGSGTVGPTNPVIVAGDYVSFDIKATSASAAGEYKLTIVDDASQDFSEHDAGFLVGTSFTTIDIPVASLSSLSGLTFPQLFLNANIKFDGTIAAGSYTLVVDNFRISDSPVPEPMAAGLLGVAGVLAMRRRSHGSL